MEILSDATFKGNVSINGGNFSVKVKGISGSEMVTSDIPLLTTNISGSSVSVYGGFYVNPFNDNKESGLTITKGKGAAAYIQFKGTEFFEGQTHFGSGFTVSDGTYVMLPTSIRVGSPASHKSITFPSTSGTLALTSQIPSVPSVAGFLKYKKVPIDFVVPADCTVFATNSGTSIHVDRVISIGLFKTETPYNNWGFAIKQVQADVLVTCTGLFVVEKSSAFAISPSDGYEIRAAYYE